VLQPGLARGDAEAVPLADLPDADLEAAITTLASSGKFGGQFTYLDACEEMPTDRRHRDK
jgi:hypothetical protein